MRVLFFGFLLTVSLSVQAELFVHRVKEPIQFDSISDPFPIPKNNYKSMSVGGRLKADIKLAVINLKDGQQSIFGVHDISNNAAMDFH